MPSPADRQAEAIADVERIGEQIYYAWVRAPHPHLAILAACPWRHLDEEEREAYRTMARGLLERDVIRVGKRPEADPQLEGQTTIDEQLADPIAFCEHQWISGDPHCQRCGAPAPTELADFLLDEDEAAGADGE